MVNGAVKYTGYVCRMVCYIMSAEMAEHSWHIRFWVTNVHTVVIAKAIFV